MRRAFAVVATAASTCSSGASPCHAQSFLFDASKAEMAGNADWVIDADVRNIGNVGGAMVPGFGSDSNPQQTPTPAASGIISTTPETYWSGGISAWGVAVVKLGYGAESLPYDGAITFNNGANPQDLSNYSVFVVCEPNILFTAAEKTAIVNFVAAGGGLMIVGDHINSDRNNDGEDSPEIWNDLFTNNGSVTNPFGMNFNFDNIVVTSSELSTALGDPIINGVGGPVAALEYHNGATITIDTTANPSVRSSVWKTSAHTNSESMAAYATYGAGRIVAIGDSSPADDGTGDPNDNLFFGWDESSNGELLTNASDWLAKTPATKYWDPDQNETNNNTITGVGLGGSGTWDNMGGFRFADGATAIYQWSDTKPGPVTFTGTAATVTLTGTRSATALTFNSNGYQLSGGTLNLSGASSIDVPSGTATIYSALSGTSGVNKLGAGTLILAGSNSVFGTVAINAGTLEIASMTLSNAVTIANGATLRGSGAATVSGGISVAANSNANFATAAASDVLTLTSVHSGGSLSTSAFLGPGTAILSGSTANTQGVNVNGGTLRLNKSVANGAIPSTGFLINGGTAILVHDASEQINNTCLMNIFNGQWQLNGFSETIANISMTAGSITGGGTITLSGSTSSGVTTFSTSAASQITANINLNGTQHTFNIINTLLAEDTVIDGVISNGTLFKNNGGTLVLAGASSNTFNTTSFVSGTLLLRKSANGVIACPGDITAGDGSGSDILRLGQVEQIANTANVSLAAGTTFDLSTFSETINNLTMSTAQLAGTGTLLLNGSLAVSAAASSCIIAPNVDLNGGARTISIVDGAASNDLVVSTGTVSNGTLNKTGAGTLALNSVAPGHQNLTLNLNAGNLNIGGSQQLAALSVAHGLTTTLTSGGTRVLGANSLSISGSGKVDLNDNRLIINFGTGASPLATIRQYILNGRNGTDFANGNWQGTGGIKSSTAAAGDLISFAIGYVENSFLPQLGLPSYTSFGGQTVNSGSLLIRYTLGADCNLDGRVNTDDVTIVGALYNNAGTSQWFLGDFDYDGVCDTDDVTVLGALYDASAPALSAAQLTAQFGSDFAAAFERGRTAGVPEPTAVSVLSLMGLSLLRPRRKRLTKAPLRVVYLPSCERIHP